MKHPGAVNPINRNRVPLSPHPRIAITKPEGSCPRAAAIIAAAGLPFATEDAVEAGREPQVVAEGRGGATHVKAASNFIHTRNEQRSSMGMGPSSRSSHSGMAMTRAAKLGHGKIASMEIANTVSMGLANIGKGRDIQRRPGMSHPVRAAL